MISRRKFLGQFSCAAVGSTTLMSSLLQLNTLNAAAALRPPEDYRALVCVLLAGGNDSFNMLVPRGQSEYQEYATVRSNQALSQSSLLAINPTTSDGKTYGVHQGMPELQQLFEDGNAAFIANVGTLTERISKLDWENGNARIPLGLLSHADQIQQWQTSIPDTRTAEGWGGRMADILGAANTNDKVSMNISLSGTNVFQAGKTTVEYAIDPYDGAKAMPGYDRNSDDWWYQRLTTAINSMADMQYSNLLEQNYKGLMKNTLEAFELFNAALASAPALTTNFSNNEVSESMKMIAKTISVRQTLGMKRQIFFITFGGWDHHDEVLNNQNNMLPVVSKALKELYDATVELGVQDLVTSFTISDFARTLTSNGNGTDHAWGSNQIVVGGAVKGKEIYGTYPDLYLNNDLDVGNGILIPTLSTDEFFAELALWYGVSTADIDQILPNIRRFYTPSLSNLPIGFMNI